MMYTSLIPENRLEVRQHLDPFALLAWSLVCKTAMAEGAADRALRPGAYKLADLFTSVCNTFACHAAYYGNITAMQTAFADGYSTWYRCLELAIMGDQIQCLKALLERPDDEALRVQLEKMSHAQCDMDMLVESAASVNRITHLLLLREYYGTFVPSRPYAPIYAAQCGFLGCFRVLIEDFKYRLGQASANNAAANGHLDILKYIQTRNVDTKWNCYAVYNAASGGHLDCLRYLHEHGWPMSLRDALVARVTDPACAAYLEEHRVCRQEIEGTWVCRL